MEMKAFNTLFPQQAEKETRNITLTESWNGLEKGNYVFFELFCTDVTCDCRRAMIQVIDDSNQLRATLSYGWEDRQFYADWMGVDDHIDDIPGVNVYSLQPQGKDYMKFLDILKEIIRTDTAYANRIQQHYKQVKKMANQLESQRAIPIRTNKKPGRNAPCPCGSGKKSKHCCLNSGLSLVGRA